METHINDQGAMNSKVVSHKKLIEMMGKNRSISYFKGFPNRNPWYGCILTWNGYRITCQYAETEEMVVENLFEAIKDLLWHII